MGPDGPKWGQEDFFPTNPDLAYILGRTDFDFEIFIFFGFFWISNLQISGSQISKFPAWARAWAQTPPPAPAAPPDEFSDPNLTPLPTHPGIKYVGRNLKANLKNGPQRK